MWKILENYIPYDECVVEIYSCFKDQEDEDIREMVVLNKGDKKPALAHSRYMVLGDFISGQVLNQTKTFSEVDNRVHILSVSKDEDNLYMDVIIGCCKKAKVIDKEKNITKRQEILKTLELDEEFLKAPKNHNVEYINEPTADLSISTLNDIESEGYSIHYIVHYKEEYKNHDIYNNMLFKYYHDRNRIPERFINEDSMICRVEMEDANITEPLKTVELKLRDKRVDYPVEKSFSLTLGKFEKGKFIEYLNPIDNKNHKVYIDSLELYDPYENIPQERKEDFKDIITEGTKLLFMTYENPIENVNMKFYLKNFLDSPIKNTSISTTKNQQKKQGFFEPTAASSTMWFIGGLNKNGEKHKNGYYLNSEVLDQSNEIHEDEIEVELLYITRIGDEHTIKFSLSENTAASLSDYKIVEKVHMDIWASIEKDYKCIRFTPEPITYCPKNCILYQTDVEYNKFSIPLGKSRIGGPVVDLPMKVEYPQELFFAAQINLSEFEECFFNNYLPEEGFLYVFIDEYGETGKVIYSSCKCKDLRRVVKEHDNCFYDGKLIKNIYAEEENINERYNTEWTKDGGEIGWDPFKGTEKSKLFGIYTNCQCEENELKEQLMEDKVLLLQIGEDFTGEGVLSIRIDKSDLERMDFSDCIFEWSQS